LHPEAVIDGALSSAAPFMQAGGGEETVVGDPEGALPIDAPLIGGQRARLAHSLAFSQMQRAAAFGRSLL
jgi:hypothetical protein